MHIRITMLARSKLNRVEKTITKLLIYQLRKLYKRTKTMFNMMNCQRSNVEKVKLIDDSKRMDEIA